MNISVSPVYLKTPTGAGWLLRMSGPGVANACYWGGGYKPSPAAAVDAYADAIRSTFPTARIRFLPASPAQVRRSLRFS